MSGTVGRSPGERRHLAAYFLLAYAFSWTWIVPMAIVGSDVERGEAWPSHLPFLAGPALAALAVTAWSSGTSGVRDLAARVLRWRVPVQWWLVALGTPFGFLAVALGAASAGAADVPSVSAFGRFNSLPAATPLITLALIVLFNGFGEEIGWRGYALPALQQRLNPFVATLILAGFWAAWHLPAFFVLESYDDLIPAGIVPFVLGLTSGAFLLTWLYNRSGASVLLVAAWHGAYNFSSGTEAADGFIAAVVSTLVMVLGISLAAREWRSMRGAGPSVIGPLPVTHAGDQP